MLLGVLNDMLVGWLIVWLVSCEVPVLIYLAVC